LLSQGVISDDQRTIRLKGLLTGTAVGDALGLPAEGLSRRDCPAAGFNGCIRATGDTG